MGKDLRNLFLITLIILCHVGDVRADWIEGYFSEKAGIDSIERFLVITDVRDSTYLGRGLEPAGDVNQDGLSDVIACRQRYQGAPPGNQSCFLFYGGEPPDSGFQRELSGMGRWIKNIGDVNADGFDDFGLSTFPITRFEVHFGGPLMDDVVDFVIPVWSRVSLATDIDNDGNLEIPLSRDLSEGYVNIYDIGVNRDTLPEYVIPDSSTSFGNNLAVGDINGDGYPDLAVAAYLNRDTNFVKFYWGGPDFDTIPDFEILNETHNFGQILLPIPDFNDDGYDDIFISGGTREKYGVYFGGPEFDDQIDIVINWGTLFYPTAAATAGDINNDGYPDLLVSYVNLGLFVNEVYLFLGGPDADSLVDVYIEGLMIPGGQANLGFDLAGVGDFNGDGIDDFAVHSQTQTGCCWTAEINFFAGWDGHVVDVPDESESDLPRSFHLKQNYPNPFNGTTTIEFELNRKSYVTLTIHNVLGEHVITLLDKEFRNGVGTVTWDGKNRGGRAVSSGVYLYTLEMEGHLVTKKMLLLK